MLFVLGFLVLSTGCSKSTTLPAIDKWTKFQSPNAGYTVLMPNKPKKIMQSGGGEMIEMYVSEVGSKFAVITYGHPIPGFDADDLTDKKIIKQTFDGGMQGMVASKPGSKLVEQKDILVSKKYPGREFTATVTEKSIGKLTMRGRMILSKKALIMTIVIATDGEIKKPQVKDCLDSITIK